MAKAAAKKTTSEDEVPVDANPVVDTSQVDATPVVDTSQVDEVSRMSAFAEAGAALALSLSGLPEFGVASQVETPMDTPPDPDEVREVVQNELAALVVQEEMEQ